MWGLCSPCKFFAFDLEIFGVYPSSKLAWQAGQSPCVKNPISSSIQVHFRVSHVSFFPEGKIFKNVWVYHSATTHPTKWLHKSCSQKAFLVILDLGIHGVHDQTAYLTNKHMVNISYIYIYVCGWIIGNPPPCSNLEPFLLKHQVLNLTLSRDSYKVGPKSADEITPLKPQWNPLVYFRPLIGDMIYIYISKFGYMKMFLYIYI